MNEFYGQKAVRRLSWITSALIAYCFLIVGISMSIPAHEIPGSKLATNAAYNLVFGQAQAVIVGSIVAFLVSQLLDAFLFEKIKQRTGNKFIWLRSTGSTMISQLLETYFEVAPTNYILKMLIAILLTPLIYLGHYLVRRYLNQHQ
jgi:uncharacterized integral membrane protein (TIGR00697 family)